MYPLDFSHLQQHPTSSDQVLLDSANTNEVFANVSDVLQFLVFLQHFLLLSCHCRFVLEHQSSSLGNVIEFPSSYTLLESKRNTQLLRSITQQASANMTCVSTALPGRVSELTCGIVRAVGLKGRIRTLARRYDKMDEVIASAGVPFTSEESHFDLLEGAEEDVFGGFVLAAYEASLVSMSEKTGVCRTWQETPKKLRSTFCGSSESNMMRSLCGLMEPADDETGLWQPSVFSKNRPRCLCGDVAFAGSSVTPKIWLQREGLCTSASEWKESDMACWS